MWIVDFIHLFINHPNSCKRRPIIDWWGVALMRIIREIAVMWCFVILVIYFERGEQNSNLLIISAFVLAIQSNFEELIRRCRLKKAAQEPLKLEKWPLVQDWNTLIFLLLIQMHLRCELDRSFSFYLCVWLARYLILSSIHHVPIPLLLPRA